MRIWDMKKAKTAAKAELISLITQQTKQISDMVSQQTDGRPNDCGITEEYLDAVRALNDTVSAYHAFK